MMTRRSVPDTTVAEGNLDFYEQESDTLHRVVNVALMLVRVNRLDVICVDILDPDKPVNDKIH